jgi:hypothetical protein
MKRITLLIAAMATLALAAPAFASAAEWQHNGKPLAEPTAIELNGKLGTSYDKSGVECPIHAVGTLSKGNTGQLTSVDVDGTSEYPCYTWGAYTHCKITGSATTPLSLELPKLNEVLIKSGKIGTTVLWTWTFENTYENSCFVAGKFWRYKGTVPATPVMEGVYFNGLKIAASVEIETNNSLGFGGLAGSLALTPANWFNFGP